MEEKEIIKKSCEEEVKDVDQTSEREPESLPDVSYKILYDKQLLLNEKHYKDLKFV